MIQERNQKCEIFRILRPARFAGFAGLRVCGWCRRCLTCRTCRTAGVGEAANPQTRKPANPQTRKPPSPLDPCRQNNYFSCMPRPQIPRLRLFVGSLWLLTCVLEGADDPVVYPQLAIGGGFEAVFLVSNPSVDSWRGTLRLPNFGSGSGVVWLLNGEDRTGLDSVEVELPARGSGRFVFSAPDGAPPVSGPLIVEGLEGSLPTDLATSLFFDYSTGGVLVDSVSVPSSPSSRLAVIPIERFPEERVNTGVAIQSGEENAAAVVSGNPTQPSFRISLYDAQGIRLDTAVNPFPGPRYVDQIFPPEAFPEGRFVGSLAVESETPFHILALRQRLLDQGRFQLTGVAPWIAPANTPVATFSARYQVTFEAYWSPQTHPSDFPTARAHFSSLVGGVHDDSVTFWQPGAPASPGIERMAEEGRTNPLDIEVQNAVRAATAQMVLIGGGIASSPGQVSLQFDINQRYPLVSLVSMIAPSPDWFVGVRGLSLFGESGWARELAVDLYPFDAGSDDGVTFTSEDADSQPHVPIRQLTGFPFLNQGVVLPMGRFVFRRLDGGASGF